MMAMPRDRRQPRKRARSRGPLRVTRWMWGRADGGPQLAYYAGGRQVACATLQVAREYAADHGYSGIRISYA